ncbi:MAG: transglycosylase domain-containing protein, partial [Actinomycetota bacterium]
RGPRGADPSPPGRPAAGGRPRAPGARPAPERSAARGGGGAGRRRPPETVVVAAALAADVAARARPWVRRAAALGRRAGRHAGAWTLLGLRRAAALGRRAGRHAGAWACAGRAAAAPLGLRARRAAAASLGRMGRRLAGVELDPATFPSRARAWLAGLAAALVPVQEQAARGWEQVVRQDAPALGRKGRALARATERGSGRALLATGRGGLRAWRWSRPLLVPVRQLAAAVVPRLVVLLAVLGLAGWFAPGPLLGAAASLAAVDRTPFRPLAQRSTVTAVDGTELGVVHGGQNRRLVPLDQVPPLVRRLVAVAEDRRFYEHDGFDQAAIVRAALANARSGQVTQGASTITQQLVKQNLVGADRSALRKVRELVLTVAVERRTSKRQLLDRYLNEVYFGNGAYGIAAAAETYFGLPPGQLRAEQAALLATLIRAPTRLDPWRDPAAVLTRRNALLREAAAAGALSPAAARAASGAELGVAPQPIRPGIADPDLVRAVEAEIAARPELGPDPATRLRRFRTGGWSVRTTIDPTLQAHVRRAAGAGADRMHVSGAAVAVVEPGTGRIRALASRRPADLGQLELATDGRRQPGSAFKPLAAIAGLEAGLDPATTLEGRSGVTFDLEPEDWEVHNFGDGDHRSVDLAGALRDSVNSAMAQVGVAAGAERLADVAGRLGIDEPAALGPAVERGPAIALGGVSHGVTALEMAGAYAAIAADGAYVRPTLIERITGDRGQEILRRAPDPTRAVDRAVNARVRSMLQEVVTSGTGTQAALPGWQPFGKTGTSQDRADAWFVGAVPDLAAAVWIGDPRSRTPMPTATGGTVAAPLWREVMTAALAGTPPTNFSPAGDLPPRTPVALPDPRPPSSHPTPE